MSFNRRRPGRDGIENDLRRYRPEPREELVRSLEARISAERPARRGFGARLGLVGALTAALLAVLGALGGIGYAASSVSHAAHAVADVFTFAPHNVGSISAAADQYGKVTLCHNGHEITVSQDAVAAHLAQGDTQGPCPVFAPPIRGTAADDVLDLSKSRVNSQIVDTQGNNTIKTNNRDNKVTTGAGNDVIDTGTGVNLVKAGAGNDTINSKGRDTIFAGPGNDTINIRNGKPNFVDCGSGRDIVIADPANIDFVSNSCEIVRRAKFQP
jgi:RTX calcium-binding nonapeptide repeat (4 copies)